MPERRWTLLALVLVADATWITAVLAVVGLGLTDAQALVPWWAVFLTLAAALAVGILAPQYAHRDGERLGGEWGRTQAMGGALALYLCLAASPASGPGLAAVWPAHLVTGEYGGAGAVGLGLAAFASLWLWRRGVRLGLEGLSRLRILDTFRYGALVVAAAALVDRGCDCGLLGPEAIWVFFAASLGALALGRLMEAGARGSGWYRVIGGSVLAVLLVGAVVSHAGSAYGVSAASAAGDGWRTAVSWIVGALAFLLTPLLELLFEAIAWLKAHLAAERIELRSTGGIGPVELPEQLSVGEVGEVLRVAVQIALLALVAWLVYRGLLFGFRSHYRAGGRSAGPEREQIDSEETAAADLAGLLLGLLPRWLRPARSGPAGWRIPDDVPEGIRETCRLYFDMLELAVSRGWQFRAETTPLERVDDLQAALGRIPVAEITGCFNAACYGRQASDPGTLGRLRESLSAPA
jgi:hypothetical protein